MGVQPHTSLTTELKPPVEHTRSVPHLHLGTCNVVDTELIVCMQTVNHDHAHGLTMLDWHFNEARPVR